MGWLRKGRRAVAVFVVSGPSPCHPRVCAVVPCTPGSHNTNTGPRCFIRGVGAWAQALCYVTVNWPAQVYFSGADERIDPLHVGLLRYQCFFFFPFL